MTELVSLREYSRRRGVSAMAVSKAAKTGRITLEGGKVNVETANRDWPANTNPAQSVVGPAALAALSEANGGQGAGDEDPPPPDSPGANGKAGAAYGQARATRERFLSLLAKIDYETATGALVKVAEVRVAAFNAARTARDSLLSMPDRLAPVLAGEADQFEVHRIMSEEIRRVCNDIANAKPI
jgi:hypothetical protein